MIRAAFLVLLLAGCTPIRIGTLTMVCLGLCARLEQTAEAQAFPPSAPTLPPSECEQGP
jgi:hypothetical protein